MSPRHTDIRSITVKPDPIVLGDEPVIAVIEVAAEGTGQVTGTLETPGGTLVPLDFGERSGRSTWVARRPFPRGSGSGAWLLTVRVPGLIEDRDLQVYGEPPPGEIAFAHFDIRPHEVFPGQTVIADGFLEVDRLGFGGQRVLIAFRGRGDDSWEQIGEAVTNLESGYFSTEVAPAGTGEVRAEFWLRPPGTDGTSSHSVHPNVVASESIAFEISAAFAGRPVATLTPPPVSTSARVRGKNTVKCYLHNGTVTTAQGADVTWGKVRIEHRPTGGGWQLAAGPGNVGKARGSVSSKGTFAIKSARKSGPWRAVFE